MSCLIVTETAQYSAFLSKIAHYSFDEMEYGGKLIR